jgi:glutamine amidotransferase
MNSPTIAVIDYGSGNLRSAGKAFEHVMAARGLPGQVLVTGRAEDIARADRIVLPGQGAFGDCISGLRAVPGMVEALEESVLRRGTPFLGICVGMQLMAEKGFEFGEHAGLGWIPGDVVKMEPKDPALKIPHMGWNNVDLSLAADHPVLRGVIERSGRTDPDFYFVHSFMFQCRKSAHVAGLCDYGGDFTAIVARDNMIGTQFHPEKSQDSGLALIESFLRWNP